MSPSMVATGEASARCSGAAPAWRSGEALAGSGVAWHDTPARHATATGMPVAVSGAQLVIDSGAIAANTELFAARAHGQVMAVVKADGFGHGATLVARTALAHGATWIGVTSVTEALALRQDGVSAPMLSWLNPIDADFGSALGWHIDLAVPSLAHLAAVEAAATDSTTIGPATVGPATVEPAATESAMVARVHLYIDCGMARDGERAQAWRELCRRAAAAQRRGVLRVVGVMGHLGCADDPTDACNAMGRRRFAWAVMVARACGLRPAHRHLAATTATLTDPLTHHSLCRIGAGLVGIDLSGTAQLRPAMTLRAPIVSVRDVPAGTPVGYGHSWRAPEATRLGLIPVGYADGVPRSASNRAEVEVRGRRCPVVGRVSMDQTVIDLGSLVASPGEWVTVFGTGERGEPTVADWARWAGTIPHEIVTGIGERVSRIVLPGDPAPVQVLDRGPASASPPDRVSAPASASVRGPASAPDRVSAPAWAPQASERTAGSSRCTTGASR